MTFLSATDAVDDRREVLAPETRAEMHEPIAVDDRRGAPWTGAHGLGLQVWNDNGERSYGHGGSMPGFLAVLRIDQDSGDGVIVMANTTAGMRPELAGDLIRIHRDGETRAAAEWLPAAPQDGVLPALGRWFWGPSPYTLRAVGSGELTLESEPAGGRSARFRPCPDGSWVGLDGYYAGETLRIEPDSDGEPRRLELASFIFTRTPYDPQADVPGGWDARGWHVPASGER